MTVLCFLIKRNTKLFFRDKGMFFSALIAPLIILLLFVTFLGQVYRDSFYGGLPEGMSVPKELVEGFVGGWLFSSLLAVCCVTVSFIANTIMVQDKMTGARKDLTLAPIPRSALALSYYLSTALVSLIVCYVATTAGFAYLAAVGWYLSPSDVLFCLLDVLLLVSFGTALSSVVCYFLSSQGGITAVTSIVSAVYGFLCGAYMPISQFSKGIQDFILFLPGTYGTGLLRNHLMGGVLNQLETEYFPASVVEEIRDNFDNHLYFFDKRVELWQMYAVLSVAILLFAGIYLLLHARIKKRKG